MKGWCGGGIGGVLLMPHTGRLRLLQNPDKYPPSTTRRGQEGGDGAPKSRLIPRDTSLYIKNSRDAGERVEANERWCFVQVNLPPMPL